MKRSRFGVGIALAVVIGAGAVAYASVPHTFSTGDILQANDLNGNFSAFDQRIAALEAARMHWDGFLPQGGKLGDGSPTSATVAHLTLTPPATGTIIVRVHFSTAVRNNFDAASPSDCGIWSELSATTTPPSIPPVAGTLGLSGLSVVGNLPTQNTAGGSYQWFPQSAEAAFAATAGTPLTIYLNGILTSQCGAAVYYGLSFNADFGASSSTLTVSAN